MSYALLFFLVITCRSSTQCHIVEDICNWLRRDFQGLWLRSWLELVSCVVIARCSSAMSRMTLVIFSGEEDSWKMLLCIADNSACEPLQCFLSSWECVKEQLEMPIQDQIRDLQLVWKSHLCKNRGVVNNSFAWNLTSGIRTCWPSLNFCHRYRNLSERCQLYRNLVLSVCHEEMTVTDVTIDDPRTILVRNRNMHMWSTENFMLFH